MARRYKSLHHNLQPGENVVFHREHRSPRNRGANKVGVLQKYKRSSRRKWKSFAKSNEFLFGIQKNLRKGKKY